MHCVIHFSTDFQHINELWKRAKPHRPAAAVNDRTVCQDEIQYDLVIINFLLRSTHTHTPIYTHTYKLRIFLDEIKNDIEKEERSAFIQRNDLLTSPASCQVIRQSKINYLEHVNCIQREYASEFRIAKNGKDFQVQICHYSSFTTVESRYPISISVYILCEGATVR